jgi:DNA-binding GntR family transcriptional regulator
MVSNVFPDWRLYEYMFRHPELLQSSLEKEYREHKAIVDAIKARDADLAVLHTIAHIQNLGKELVDYLSIPADLIKGKEQQLGSLT